MTTKYASREDEKKSKDNQSHKLHTVWAFIARINYTQYAMAYTHREVWLAKFDALHPDFVGGESLECSEKHFFDEV